MRSSLFKATPLALALAFPLLLGGCDAGARLSADEHIERAKTFQSQGDQRAGILELKNAVQKEPDNMQARWLLGLASLDVRLGGDAEAQLERAVQLGIPRASARLPIARAQFLQANYTKILDTLHPTDDDAPGVQAQILELRGSALLGLQRPSEGCPLYERAIALDDRYGPAYSGRARCQFSRQQPGLALTSAQRATELAPTHLESWYLLADLHRVLGQNDQALTAYEQALKVKPNDYDALAYKAMALLSLGRMDEAQTLIQRLNNMRPQAHPTKYLRAYVAYQNGQNNDAINLLQQILKDAPDNVQANLLYGTVNYVIKNNEIALSSLNRVLSVADLPDARLLLAATQLRMNAHADAERTLAPLVAQADNPKALLLAGQVAMNLGDLDRGMGLLARANTLAPKDNYIRTALAQGQIVTGNPQGIRGLESVITDDPEDTQAHLLLAGTQFARGDFAGARVTLQKMAQAQPGNPTPALLEGRIHLRQGQAAAARQAFERSLAIDPQFLPAIDELAGLDLRENKPSEARERFKRVLALSPNHLGALLGQARVARLLDDAKAYETALKQAIAAHPQALEPATQLVHHYLQARKQPAEALKIARAAAGANSGNPAFLDLLGQAQLGAGQHKDAVDTFTNVTNRTPQSVRAWHQLAWAQRGAGDLQSAVSSLQKAVRLAPDNAEIRTALAGVYALQGQQDLALQTAREFQRSHPQSLAAYTLEAELAARFQQPERALKALESAHRAIASADTAATYHLALLRARQTANAQALARQWLAAHPRDTDFRLYLGSAEIGLGNPARAQALYREILAINPQHGLALNNLAALLIDANDPTAHDLARQAHALLPDNPVVIDTYGWSLFKQGRAAEALPLLQRAAQALPAQPAVQYHFAAALAQTGKRSEARTLLDELLKTHPRFAERAQAHALQQSLASARSGQ